MASKECRARINENGRVVIPAAFRKRLGMKAGDVVVLSIEDDEIRVSTLQRRLAEAQQWMRQRVAPGRSLADELIAERRKAAHSE